MLECGFLFTFYSNYGRICSRLWDIYRQKVAWPCTGFRSRSLEMAPIDWSHTSSCSPSIVSMALSRIACEIDLLVENRETLYPVCIYRPGRGWPRRNFVKMYDADKTRMIGVKLRRCVKPFTSDDTGTSRTDGQTDRRTELLYQYRASVCWRAMVTVRS